MSKTHYIHINSELDRLPTDLTTSSWTSYLSSPVLVGSSLSEVRISLESVEIPNVLYNFPIESSRFYWIVDVGGVETLNAFQIATNRNFASGDQFATYMTNGLAAFNVRFTFDALTNKLSIHNDSANPIKVVESFRYNVVPNTFNMAIDKLGFTQAIPSFLAPSQSITAQTVLRLLRTNCYYIACENASASYKQSLAPAPYRASAASQIIGRVSAENFGALSKLAYPPASHLRLPSENINFLKFTIFDDNLYPIEDMYTPITLTVKITVN